MSHHIMDGLISFELGDQKFGEISILLEHDEMYEVTGKKSNRCDYRDESSACEVTSEKNDILNLPDEHDLNKSHNKSSSFNSYLIEPTQINTSGGIFMCETCDKSFMKKPYLRKHMTRMHNKDRRFLCEICDESFPSRYQLTNHIRTHDTNDKLTSCNMSSEILSQEKTMKEHIVTHGDEEQKHTVVTHTGEKPFSCTICNKSFLLKKYLKKHTRIHSNEKPCLCEVCFKSFTTKTSLERHMLLHATRKIFLCTICDSSFRSSECLEKHSQIHSGQKPHSCGVCCKSFGCKASLKSHMMTHTGEKLFPCPICNKGFKGQAWIKKHIQTHYVREKAFSCDVCWRSFAAEESLKTHMLKHTSKRPFPCNICNISFIDKSYLEHHIQKHGIPKKGSSCSNESFPIEKATEIHKMTDTNYTNEPTGGEEKFFACDYCGQEFRQKCQVERHIGKHMNEKAYSCGVCGKSYPSRYSLKDHTKIHTSEKNFQCDICGKRTRTKYALIGHIRTHTREPFSCEICQKRFRQLSSLHFHVKNTPHAEYSSVKAQVDNEKLHHRKSSEKRQQNTIEQDKVLHSLKNHEEELHKKQELIGQVEILKNAGNTPDKIFEEDPKNDQCMARMQDQREKKGLENLIAGFYNQRYGGVIIKEEVIVKNDEHGRKLQQPKEHIQNSPKIFLSAQSLQTENLLKLPDAELLAKTEIGSSQNCDTSEATQGSMEPGEMMQSNLEFVDIKCETFEEDSMDDPQLEFERVRMENLKLNSSFACKTQVTSPGLHTDAIVDGDEKQLCRFNNVQAEGATHIPPSEHPVLDFN